MVERVPQRGILTAGRKQLVVAAVLDDVTCDEEGRTTVRREVHRALRLDRPIRTQARNLFFAISQLCENFQSVLSELRSIANLNE